MWECSRRRRVFWQRCRRLASYCDDSEIDLVLERQSVAHSGAHTVGDHRYPGLEGTFGGTSPMCRVLLEARVLRW